MKILNLMKILLLCVMTAGLASCGDDNYYTIQNSDEKLCSDSWVEEYDTEKGACRHILEFTKGKQGGKEVLSGKETFIVTTTEKDEKVFEHIVPVHAGLGPEFVRTGRR